MATPMNPIVSSQRSRTVESIAHELVDQLLECDAVPVPATRGVKTRRMRHGWMPSLKKLNQLDGSVPPPPKATP